MNRAVRTVLMAATLLLPLGGCGSMPDAPDFDPTDWLAGDWFGTKKPLPGQRKELFPGGVPGVSRGVPPDLVKGNQPPPGAEDAAADTALVVEEPKPKPKPKAKPRPKVAAKPAPVAPASTPTSVTVRRADQPPPQQQQQQPQSSGVQWPDPPPPVQQRQGAGAVQWPDPPPPR
jgi:hypothetical protein